MVVRPLRVATAGSSQQVWELQRRGSPAQDVLEKNASLREILNFIGSGALNGSDSSLFRPLLDRLLYDDQFLALADSQAYAECQVSTL